MFQKFTKAESFKVLPKRDHEEIEEELEREGVKSMKNLSKDSRNRVSQRLDTDK